MRCRNTVVNPSCVGFIPRFFIHKTHFYKNIYNTFRPTHNIMCVESQANLHILYPELCMFTLTTRTHKHTHNCLLAF